MRAMDIAQDQRCAVYVVRQPIVQASGRVYAYQLLYRTPPEDATPAPQVDLDLTSARVFTDVLLNLGLETITNNRRAFLKLSPQLLLNGAASLLPSTATVLELPEDLPVDETVIDACRQLRRDGYWLALDRFRLGRQVEALLPFVTFAKVDVLTTTAPERAAIASRLMPLGVRLIAEGVNEQDQADETRAAGYSLAQGYFFCRPKTISGGAIPPQRVAAIKVLAALNHADVTIGEIDTLVSRDVSLSYRVLRCVNSAAFGVGREIHSIREALVFLGTEQVRKWASVWALAGAHSGESETVNVSLMRARCCEIIGGTIAGTTGAEFFLLGLCSLLDAILERPMELVIDQLPLAQPIRQALLGEQNLARAVLDTVIAYERGEWENARWAAKRAGCSATLLPRAYADAVQWSHQLANNTVAA
jgi:c-di-GMP-related signal transduction protein